MCRSVIIEAGTGGFHLYRPEGLEGIQPEIIIYRHEIELANTIKDVLI
jgi:hypothetical protein